MIQLCLGAIYAWSAFTGRLTAADGPFQFSKTQTQVVFSLVLLSFAVVMALVAGGRQRKVGPRIVALTAASSSDWGMSLAGCPARASGAS